MDVKLLKILIFFIVSFSQCIDISCVQGASYGREKQESQSPTDFRRPTNGGSQTGITNQTSNLNYFNNIDEIDYFDDLDDFNDDLNDETYTTPQTKWRNNDARKTNNFISTDDSRFETFGKLAKSPSFQVLMNDVNTEKIPEQYRHWTREFLQQTLKALEEAGTSLSETRQFFNLMLKLPDLMNEIDETTKDIEDDPEYFDEEEFENNEYPELLDRYERGDFEGLEDMDSPFKITNYGFGDINANSNKDSKIIFDENEIQLINEFEKLAKSLSISEIISETSSAIMHMPIDIRNRIVNFLNFTKEGFKNVDSPLAYLPEFYSQLLLNPQLIGKMHDMLAKNFVKDANIADITVDNFFAPLRQYIIDEGTKLSPSNTNQGTPARMFKTLTTAPPLVGTVMNAIPNSVTSSNVNVNAISGGDTLKSDNGGKTGSNTTSPKNELGGNVLKMDKNSTDDATKPSIVPQNVSSVNSSKDEKQMPKQQNNSQVIKLPKVQSNADSRLFVSTPTLVTAAA